MDKEEFDKIFDECAKRLLNEPCHKCGAKKAPWTQKGKHLCPKCFSRTKDGRELKRYLDK